METVRQAANVRLRAERRVGQLLKELDRAETSKGGDVKSDSRTGQPKSTYALALDGADISLRQASRFQPLANVPETEFEAALADPQKKPIGNKIAFMGPRMAQDSYVEDVWRGKWRKPPGGTQ